MEAEIVRHLTAKWSPEVILLGGSRALGEHAPQSDWDLYLLGDYPSRDSVLEELQGNHLDVVLRPKGDQDYVLKTYWSPVRALKVLKDNSEQLGARIVDQTRKTYDRGPIQKSLHEIELDRIELARSVAKISSHSSDAEACFSTLGQFHRLAIQFWFEKHHRWSLPPHLGLPIIRKEDLEFASVLQEISGSSTIETKLRACSKIQELIWET